MGIVDDLLDHPGLYVGTDTAVGRDLVGAARIVVTKLPGGAGVSLDYEILNGLAPGSVLGHVEHTMVGKAADGTTIMVIAHTHGEGISIIRVTATGWEIPGA
ncbi:MAG: hypothetical protein ACHQDC_09215 [Acidimicrobiales bacterium]